MGNSRLSFNSLILDPDGDAAGDNPSAQAVRARYQRYGLLERTSARDPAVLRGAQRARQHGVRSADGEEARQVGRLALDPRCEACCAA